ncbi:MAG: hypothetical protein LUG60_02225 [Erysipelotrichaceae bacterium]|nr:hypothetical protein [Erysipelotrichaceae bacterium]
MRYVFLENMFTSKDRIYIRDKASISDTNFCKKMKGVRNFTKKDKEVITDIIHEDFRIDAPTDLIFSTNEDDLVHFKPLTDKAFRFRLMIDKFLDENNKTRDKFLWNYKIMNLKKTKKMIIH